MAILGHFLTLALAAVGFVGLLSALVTVFMQPRVAGWLLLVAIAVLCVAGILFLVSFPHNV